MQARVHYHGIAALISTALLIFSGVASAQLLKDEQKCVNTTNKNAQKIGDAEGKDIAACVKDRAKNKVPNADVCNVADAKGKVAKAKSGYDSKTSKDCASGSGFMALADATTAKAAAMNKELDIIHMIFGSDLIDDLIIEEATNKTDSKCQQALVKAVYKCQATKWKEYNSCKKNKIKGKDTSQATSAAQVQDECTGTGTGSIPDPKGKIGGKCDFSGTISKKCPNPDIFPGCPGGSLNACLDAIVECKWCEANNTIDGLGRNCDLFDDGVANGSCDAGGLSCQHELARFCDGGANDGLACTDINGSSDCPPGFPTARCVPTSFARLESVALPPGIIFELIGGSSFEVGDVDPNTGTASMECGLPESIGLVIPSIGVACLTDVGGCDPGVIDCNGGTALDLDTVHHHSVDKLIFDPNHPLFNPSFDPADCRGTDLACFTAGDSNCTAHETCAAMCELYCASLPGNYTVFDSGCEGFCRGGLNDNELCTLAGDCEAGGVQNSGVCIGGRFVAHAGSCTCDCLEVGSGGPSPPGSFWCQVGIQSVLETIDENNCDGDEIILIIGQQCVPRTTETITNTVNFADADEGNTVNQFDQGTRISCDDLVSGNLSGLTTAGNQTVYDGDLGDSATRTIQACE